MEYLYKKWTMWYRSLDVNHDGGISFDDVEECRKKFVELNNLPDEKAKEINSDVEKWWTTYILPNKGATLTLEEFLDKLTKEYTTDKAAFVGRMNTCFSTLFNVFDTNKDKDISVEEMIVAFKAFGHDNEKIVRHNFTQMEPADDTVPLEKVVKAWVQFVTCDDPSKKDIVRDSFEEGI